ncbi:bifunctional hydroxymethylpyrimidine kinase/phosphomethylpyrimidine kinase [Edaphobacillus lindanitolerans]|uniref:Hydroxymethylpyrimidine/phosphomethylpyrimidine kinase n=1 Tax=Edaphobacillus lindanitolerans TaxID=550447 RepID=A0A1U7PR69_9BACI|nr:bifunctional hydroxymethylpyrimidine kinase/phosphomethylpyrimidine kinase [Edaphobacillus lindanitolerans]SIT87430.1 hydroxymethylpyrimidine/phosphomethylpyrimidine kinase [Edaphobacillus lindanitolerans]
MTHVAMTIAGSDSGGGAGIQADLKTFQELGVFGTSALTAVTAQNTLGVHGVWPLDPEAVTAQMDAVFDDFRVSAVKTGMLFSSDIIRAVARSLEKAGRPALIVDPVMIAKGGAHLLQREAAEALVKELIPLAAVVTPNIPEAEELTGTEIHSEADMEDAARRLLRMGARAAIIKGGHRTDERRASDLYVDADGNRMIFSSERIATKDTHGTGCTFSAALTAFLASGKELPEAAEGAKRFILAAIADGLGLGAGHGPTNHWAYHRLGGMSAKGGISVET